MMDESPEDHPASDEALERWAEVARGRAPPPSAPQAWSELFEPLAAEQRERIIDGALARAEPEVAEPEAAVHPPSRRASVGWAMAAALAVAAGLVLALRTPAPSPGAAGGFDIEMHARAELRGAGADATDPRTPVELRLRNETGWIVRAEHAAATLYLVAHEPGQAPRRLDARIDAQHGAFRVRGEVGTLGLVPGDVTVYFVLGPPKAEAEALRVAQAAIEGQAPPSDWSIDARRLRILE